MTKKNFMLEIINSLPDRKMGRGIKALLENDQLADDIFERLYEIFRKSIHETYDEIQREELKKRIQTIHDLHKQEEQKNEQEILDLEAMLDAL